MQRYNFLPVAVQCLDPRGKIWSRYVIGDDGPGKKTFGRAFHGPVFAVPDTKPHPAFDISSRLTGFIAKAILLIGGLSVRH